jgi:hypothetical protein
MAHVNFLLTENTGQRVIGQVVLGDNNTVHINLPEGVAELVRSGVRYGGRLYTPKDGVEFLRMLRFGFSGDRVRATDVIHGEPETTRAGPGHNEQGELFAHDIDDDGLQRRGRKALLHPEDVRAANRRWGQAPPDDLAEPFFFEGGGPPSGLYDEILKTVEDSLGRRVPKALRRRRPFVEFLLYGDDPEPTVMGRAFLDNNYKVAFKGLSESMRELAAQPIEIGAERYRIEEGLVFLAALKYEWSGERIRATEVQYEDAPDVES